jgi:hypothetical protein
MTGCSFTSLSRGGARIRQYRGGRVTIAIGRDFHGPSPIAGPSRAARAFEARDPKQRRGAIKLILERRLGLKKLEPATLRIRAVT